MKFKHETVIFCKNVPILKIFYKNLNKKQHCSLQECLSAFIKHDCFRIIDNLIVGHETYYFYKNYIGQEFEIIDYDQFFKDYKPLDFKQLRSIKVVT